MLESSRAWIIGLLALAAGVAARSGGAADEVLEDEAPVLHRAEYFELRATPAGPAVGFASLHRIERGSATSLEWQIRFPEDELQLFHVETFDAHGAHWIWRERQPRCSRSVAVERTADVLNVTEWGRPVVWRTVLPSGSVSFPLELEERLRAGLPCAEGVALFDPLSNSIETVHVETCAGAPGDLLRRVELVRDDGSQAGSYTFHGAELAGFSWQRGGLIAVRVGPEQFPAGTLQVALEGPRSH